MGERAWTHIIVHHTGAEERNAEQVRRYHLSLGWQEIGYHFVIERNGAAAPGRGLHMAGAHCHADGMNYKGIGIAILGNLNNHPPLPAQLKALEQLIRNLQGRFQIPAACVLGHKEVPGAATVCPGVFVNTDALRALLREPAAAPRRLYRVQAGAFTVRENAERLAGELHMAGFPAIVTEINV